MKTHIPASLRKALLAALFATASIATTAYAGAGVTDVVNSSEGWASPWLSLSTYDSTGYTDLTLNGTDSMLGTVDHWCHDWDALSGADDNDGEDTYIYLTPDASTGKFIAHSITANLGKSQYADIDDPDSHDHTDHSTYGYSTSWSNGNITVDDEAVLEVTTNINAHGTFGITGSSRVTAGNKVSAGEIKVTSGQLTAKDISVTANNLWNPGEADYDSTGELLVSGSGAEVTATGTVSAAGGVNVSNGAHLNAGKITSNVTGSKGYVHALPNQNLVITDAIASEGTQYIVDNGCTITLSGIGLLVNEGTPEEPRMVMHGNGNYFGYGADSNNIKADAIYVLGSIISDNNGLAALGSAVYDHMVDPNSSAIYVKGSITGNGNELFVRSQDAAGIWVDKNISGNNNDLTINDGDIHIGGALGRSHNDEKGMAKGNSITAGDNITIHQLSDNDGLNIDAMNGEVTIEQAADATIVNSNISADDDITIAKDAASTAELKLTKSHIVSDNGDITIGQYVVADATSSIEAEEGDVNIHGLTANGATVKAVSLDGTEFIRLDGTGTTDTTVSVEEDMTSSNGSIFIRNYNGEEPRITVGGDMRANLVMDIASANITVGGNQATETDSMSIDGTTLTVGGNQTSGKNLTTSSSKVDVAGDQSAVGRAEIHSTTLNVGGNQTSGKNLVIDSASKVTVGHVDEETGELVGGTQSAGKDIQIANSIVEVLRDQEATNGAISITDGSTVTVGTAGSQVGHVIDNPNYKIDPNETIYIGIIEPGDISTEERLRLAQALPNEATGGNQTAKGDITIVDSTVTVLGNQKATEGSIAISSTPGTGITSEVFVGGNQEAGNGISVTGSQLTVGTAETVTDEQTGEQHVVLTGGNQTADKGDIAITNSKVGVLGDQTATEGGIKIDKLSLVTIGMVDVDGTVLAGDQLAKEDIRIDSSTLMVMDNQTSQEGSISVQALNDFSLVMVGGSQTAKKHIGIFGSKEHEKPTTVLVGKDQIAGEGNIAINDAQVAVKGKVVALGDGNDGTGIVTLAGATYDVGVSLQAKELNIGTIDNPSTVTINVDSLDADGETPLPTVLDVDKLMVDEGNTLHTGNVKMDAADVTIHGTVEAGVKDTEDPDNDIAADWKVTGSHDISGANAHLMANGDIEIVATEEGDAIRIADGAKVSATGDITIQGLAAALAEVDGATVRATGDIILDRAELTNNHDKDVSTRGGDIVLKNRVEISDTILNTLPTEEGDEGVINVTEGADVQLYRGAEIGDSVNVFNGKLAGTGSVTANDDNLTLYHDATAFNGTINLVRDNEQALNIACEGVGEDAVINLTEGSSLYTIVGGQGAHLGNVNTTDGSHIQLTAVDEGNTASATTLCLTEGTTYDVFATAGAETGALVSDCITVTGGVDALGAKVAVHTEEAMETIKPGSRFTIVAGDIATEFNEDVLYDRVKPIGGSSSTLRKLQTRNMHLEHNANGVDLVVSENYKGLNSKNANVNAVREVLIPLDFAADHRPGVLAQSASNLDHILDALDYTRSGGDAEKGLLSVSAAANLIVPNMMMDSSRHHLSTLRDHMNAPVCTKTVVSKGNLWGAYSGGHDFIGGDDNMDRYSRNYNGGIVGGDYAVNCNWAIGMSAGYEGSIARTTGARANVDTTFIDAYAVGRTGKFIHKFSVGVGIHRASVTRATNIAAKGHTYHGSSKGKVRGNSVNFGYDVARLYAIDEVSSVSPFFAVDLAIQSLKTLKETGQDDASVITKYKNFTQLDAALGVSYAHTFQAFAQQAGVFSVSLALHGEFSAHRATADNHFVGAPADTWKTRSVKRAPLYGELGGNVLVPFTEHFSGTAGVSFEFSDDRTYIGGHAGVNYRF